MANGRRYTQQPSIYVDWGCFIGGQVVRYGPAMGNCQRGVGDSRAEGPFGPDGDNQTGTRWDLQEPRQRQVNREKGP